MWTLGKGMPLVHMPGLPISHIQMEWQNPGTRRWYEQLAERRQLVRYDSRGTGMSARGAVDFSLDAQVADLDAVARRLGLQRFALGTFFNSTPAGILYAARYPERVSHLLMWDAWARASDWSRSPKFRALGGLVGRDWKTYTETYAHTIYGWSQGEEARRAAAMLRESVAQEAMPAWADAVRSFDVSDHLPEITSPTLVIHLRQNRFLDIDVARGLASRIPDARLVILDEPSFAEVGPDALHTAIEDFLGENEEVKAGARLPEGMAVILFADIAESTALTQRLGDAAFRTKARELDTALRSIIRGSGGTTVEGKVLGDGVLAVFTSARQAIECALRCGTTSEPLELQLHLGIHAGDVIREGSNIYGGAVNIAARIATASEPGEVLVSDTVRSLGRTSADVTFDDRGERTLKGVGEPQRLFAVREGS